MRPLPNYFGHLLLHSSRDVDVCIVCIGLGSGHADANLSGNRRLVLPLAKGPLDPSPRHAGSAGGGAVATPLTRRFGG